MWDTSQHFQRFFGLSPEILDGYRMLSPRHSSFSNLKHLSVEFITSDFGPVWRYTHAQDNAIFQNLGSTTLAVRSNSGKSHGCPWSICCVRSPRTGKQGDKSSVVVTQQQSTFPWDSAREYFGQGRALSNRNVIRVPATKINLELLLVDLSLSARACVPFPFFRKKKIFPSLVRDKLLHSCCILPSQAERLFI